MKNTISGQQMRKPLDGSTFYLDVSGHKEAKQLEERLIKLGANVETFLTKNITYFVTNAEDTCNLRRSPRHVQTRKVLTRAQRMIEQATKASPRPTQTILERALQFGLSIQSLQKTLSWLKEVEARVPSRIDHKATSSTVELKSPFIKVEDKTKRYQPIYKELKFFPMVHISKNSVSSPFEQSSDHSRKRLLSSKTKTKSSPSKLTKNFKGMVKGSSSKQGYCELCDVQYKHRGQHLKGKQHGSHVTAENFAKLDQMIAGGKEFKFFLQELKQKQRKNSQNMSPSKMSPPRPRNTSELKSDKTIPSSEIKMSAITPLKVTFSPTSGYALKKLTKETLPNSSSTESIDCSNTQVEGSNKRMKLNDYTCVYVSDLTLKLKRVTRRSGKLGTEIIQFPTFETSSHDLARLGTPCKNSSGSVTRNTRNNVKLSSKDFGKLRRSRRVIAKQRGSHHIKCPVLVKSTEQ